MTLPHAPPEAMQFGGTLHQLLLLLLNSDWKFGSPRLSKHDVKDGFDHMFLQVLGCLGITIVLPKYEGETQLVAIPMSFTIIWVQSPPTFCTMSETICNLANHRIALKAPTPEHRLESPASALNDLDYSLSPHPHESSES